MAGQLGLEIGLLGRLETEAGEIALELIPMFVPAASLFYLHPLANPCLVGRHEEVAVHGEQQPTRCWLVLIPVVFIVP